MLNRVIYNDNGTLTDITSSVSKQRTGAHTFSYTTNEDYIYIGQRSAFNHVYTRLGSTVNAISATPSIELWDGSTWNAVVDILDSTSALNESGIIEFTPNQDDSWVKEDTEDMTSSGLETISIYNMYWIRLSFDTTLTPDVVLEYIGQKFCEDEDVVIEYPEFDRSGLKLAFESTKTNWSEQEVRASELIIKDLIDKGVIEWKGQIITREELKLVAVSKTAEVIFSALGNNYEDDRIKARKEYQSRIKIALTRVDRNNDGLLSSKEAVILSGRLIR